MTQNWKLIQDFAPMSETGFPGTVIADNRLLTSEHPKLKFNFTMEIEYRADIDPKGSSTMAGLTIPLKSITRPAVTANMVDLNFYNYRTKTPTKMDYGTVTVVLYDTPDESVSHEIMQELLREMSPISRVDVFDKTLIDDPTSVPFGAMSSLGAMESRMGPVRVLKVYHHYVINGVHRYTGYAYLNPKLSSTDLGELNMSESDVTLVSMTFTYDGYTVFYDGSRGTVNVGDLEQVSLG